MNCLISASKSVTISFFLHGVKYGLHEIILFVWAQQQGVHSFFFQHCQQHANPCNNQKQSINLCPQICKLLTKSRIIFQMPATVQDLTREVSNNMKLIKHSLCSLKLNSTCETTELCLESASTPQVLPLVLGPSLQKGHFGA